MPVNLDKAPPQSPEYLRSDDLHEAFVRDGGDRAVRLVVEGVDGVGVTTGAPTRNMSPHNILLNATHPDPRAVRRAILSRPMKRTIENAAQVVEQLAMLPEILSPAQVTQRSERTLGQLRSKSLSVSAPVPAGSEGKEAYDLTQRDRKMFEAGSGGASRYESYASELFAGVLAPEMIEHIAQNLDGKTVFNLGGGNSRLTEELAVHGAKTEVINVEPYASDKAKNEAGYDRILEENPAKSDFFEKSHLPPHSADEIWAVYSVPAYLGSPEEVRALFNNITSLIKPGGVVRISHLGIVGAKEGDPRVAALIAQLESAKDEGFLLETTKTSRGITLLMTAPQDLV